MFCSGCGKERQIEIMLVKRGNPNRETRGVFHSKKLGKFLLGISV